jgi:hypothetical protein
MQSVISKTRPFYFVVLLALICAGIVFRFVGVNWNQDANLHPDEYGLTNTLTQLSFSESAVDYFNTRLSPLSPYHKYDEAGQVMTNGPDNRMRWGQWPIILLRGLAEITGNTGYGEIRIMGRIFTAVLDSLTVLFIFLIGWQLYGVWIGLLGCTLSSLAVMQIQQSHFMTVDNFAVFFSILAMFGAVQIARSPLVHRNVQTQTYEFNGRLLKWYILFGISFGMALASKVNLAPLGGMILAACFISIADLKLRNKNDLARIFQVTFLLVAFTYVMTLITFRVCQPMSFRAASGDTSIFTLDLNKDWIDSMAVAQRESSGGGGGPPAEQWTDRPMIIFPWVNMVLWGMGIPLGIAAWAGFMGIGYQLLRTGRHWQAHLLPLVWTGGYFFFMATRWVKSMRYFLPIYPFLCLMAAWGLVNLFRYLASADWPDKGKLFRAVRLMLAALPAAVVIAGTLVWASVFVRTIYHEDHTRVQATKWIYQNIPAPIHLQTNRDGENVYIPISVPDGQVIIKDQPFQRSLSPAESGILTAVRLPHVSFTGEGHFSLLLSIATDPEGRNIVDASEILVPASGNPRGVNVEGDFQGVVLEKGKTYYLTLSTDQTGLVSLYRNIIANEDWDEGLPFAFDGHDPFGQFYQGTTMNVRWMDDENKRAMFYEKLAQVDYIILPSQRGIWSACRLPLMYPMTLEYYRALFDGRLGFDLAANFQAPFKIGPVWVSDVGGTFAWNRDPEIPLFNFNAIASEEAFSVYDHPPVRIFVKSNDFSMEDAKTILGSIDLSVVKNQNPKDTKVIPFK